MKEKSNSEQTPAGKAELWAALHLTKLMEISREGLESLVTAIKRK